MESHNKRPFIKKVLVSFKTLPTFKLRTVSAMPFELKGLIKKSLEKILKNFSYCIFENKMDEEDLKELELTEQLKGTFELIDKQLIGDKRKIENTPNMDDSSYRHKFQFKRAVSVKCDYCMKLGADWLCTICGYKSHGSCKSMVHRSEKCVVVNVKFFFLFFFIFFCETLNLM